MKYHHHRIKIKNHVSFFTRARYMGEIEIAVTNLGEYLEYKGDMPEEQEYYRELLKYYVKKYGLMQGVITYSKKGFKIKLGYLNMEGQTNA